jgi:hypothetical protein
MAQSFDVVEEKICEAEFFLNQLSTSSRLSFEAQCYFSAFVSAARSVTLVLQATMNGIPGFEQWYQGAQAKLKTDPLAPFFVEIRNSSIHKGLNPLNQVTLDHLREDLFNQMRRRTRSHVLVLPDMRSRNSPILADAVQASTHYFVSLVKVVFECYDRFKCVVDPQWYFTREHFAAMGKTFPDAISELGFPPAWASCVPPEDDGWRAFRLQQPTCQINHLFRKYIGNEIAGPDEVDGTPAAVAVDRESR